MPATSKPTPKRGPGRPRNAEIDKLAKELGVTARQARNVLNASKKSDGNLSPLAAARLEKILHDIEFLETKIRTARLEERRLSNELLFLDEARELTDAGLRPIVASLQSMPKTLAPRLHNQSRKSIESALADFSDRLVDAARKASEKFTPTNRKSL